MQPIGTPANETAGQSREALKTPRKQGPLESEHARNSLKRAKKFSQEIDLFFSREKFASPKTHGFTVKQSRKSTPHSSGTLEKKKGSPVQTNCHSGCYGEPSPVKGFTEGSPRLHQSFIRKARVGEACEARCEGSPETRPFTATQWESVKLRDGEPHRDP